MNIFKKFNCLLSASTILGIFTIGCTTMQNQPCKYQSIARPVNLPYEKILPGPVSDYEIMKSHSTHGTEYILEVSRLSNKGIILHQKRGRSCAVRKPWLMARNINTQKGLAASLAYSGNWRIEVLPHENNTLFRISTVPETLKPFKEVYGLPMPGALVSEFSGHWDNGAQPIVRFTRQNLLRDLGDDWPLVQYNTWYDSAHRLDENHLLQTVTTAAELGCELFVIDAGWYGQGKDAHWHEGLGQWTENLDRLPHGIKPIEEMVHKLDMKFGLWVEIENANPNSPVIKEHPDWILMDGNTPASIGNRGNRRCLDFGNPKALEWAMSQIDHVVTAYNIDYIKMDFNTDLLIVSKNYKGPSSPLSKHYEGLCKLWDYMRKKYPDLIVENCSSGSQRHDLMTAAHTDTHWVSDAISNEHNLAMNFGATYMFPPETCNHWTCKPRETKSIDLKTCFTINMLGQMGLSGTITNWTPTAREYAAECISLYKKIRPIIRNADVYHLTDQVDFNNPSSIQAVQYTDHKTDQTVLFIFHAGDPNMQKNIILRSLKMDTSYSVDMPERFGQKCTLTGLSLMTDGLNINFPNRGSSAVIQIKPTKGK